MAFSGNNMNFLDHRKKAEIIKYFIDEKIDFLSSNIKNDRHFQNLLLDFLYKIINDFSMKILKNH